MLLPLLLLFSPIFGLTAEISLEISEISLEISVASGCILNIDNSTEWPEKPPILTDQAGDLLVPKGDQSNRQFLLEQDQLVFLGCPLTEFVEYPEEDFIYGQCTGGGWWKLWTDSGSEWTERGGLGKLGCTRQPDETVTIVGQCGPGGGGTAIKIDFDITESLEGEAVTITVCHDMTRSASLWAKHMLWDEIRAKDTGHNRPSFKADDFFSYDVDNFYKTATQHETIADLVGSQDLADQYVQAQNTNIFLSRGHLAPNADFIFGSWMDSSFHFVNVAPQWQCFNGGNWATLEDHCRDLAVERGLDLVVYTGTHGVIQLADIHDNMVDIYLYNRDQLPVPRYFWKILYDPLAGSGVALIGINNPHLKAVSSEMVVCPPLASHPLIMGLSDPEDIKKGYMWACRVEDLAAVFPEVPPLPALTILE